MRSLLTKLKADTFPVVVAASSVIRPGSLGQRHVAQLRAAPPGQGKPGAPPPSLEFLNETYGVMIYQEDVMRTLHAVAGMSLAEADVMRRAHELQGRPQEVPGHEGSLPRRGPRGHGQRPHSRR